MQHQKYKKVVLVVLDGFGVASSSKGNAIAQAKLPTFDYITNNFPCLTLQASGPLVGLPWGEMGNSEVGHLNIGAGRIVGQDLPRITSSIQSGEFLRNPAFLKAVEHVKKNNSSLHLLGMVSAGGVHSLDEHLYALLGLAGEYNLSRVYIHMFTDGRDTYQKVALDTIKEVNERIERSKAGRIASLAGRFYAMDRGGHYNQTKMIYDALVLGAGQQAFSPEECVKSNYEEQIFDEMIKPTVILKQDGEPVGKVSDNDAVIFFNFRQDRTLQLTQMFVAPEKIPQEFRQKPLQNLLFVTMTEYAKGLPVEVAFPSIDLKNNLAEVLSKNNLKQFHIAESEKYAHVTAFFNCGMTDKFPGEERIIVASPENGRNYVDQPEMSAPELTKILCEKISSSDNNFFIANYANGDMVGHTGNLRSAMLAVESLDVSIKQVMETVLKNQAVLIITADHGNCEQMINLKTGEIDKDHTTNPVPFLFIGEHNKLVKKEKTSYVSLSAQVPAGAISDIAPTILELFGIPKPSEMTGMSLLGEIENKLQEK
jgi:2,3-bisphosphoglycerate-independent phosphoglycerate mutase